MFNNTTKDLEKSFLLLTFAVDLENKGKEMTYQETKQLYGNKVAVIYLMEGERMLQYIINERTNNEFFSVAEAKAYIDTHDAGEGKYFDLWDDAIDMLDDLIEEQI